MSRTKHRVISLTFSAVLAVLTLSSCNDRAEQESINTDYNEIEQLVFDEWVAANRVDLLGSRQSDGYYIEFDDSATTSGDAVIPGGYICYNITTSDMDSNIYNNRNETMAVQQWRYNRYTRYAPMTDYVPSESDDIEADEAIEFAFMSSELRINGVMTDVEFKAGTKFTLYTRSELAGTINGVGGYAGQYSHMGYRPVKLEVEVTAVMNYPGDSEKSLIDQFIKSNTDLYPTSDWTLLNDEEAHYIRLNTNYTPSESTPFTFTDAYPYEKLMRDNAGKVGEAQSVLEMNQMINAELVELYEEDKSDDIIDTDNSCYIWYIARTLDGFIVDTNIKEVQQRIYGVQTSNTTYLNYSADDDKEDYISAWYYAIPNMKYGEWAAFLTTSKNAYDYMGTGGGSAATEIPPHTPLLFEVYTMPTYDYSIDEDVE